MNDGINIEAVAELVRDISALIKELKKLEQQLISSEKQVNAIDAAFGSLKNFNEFVKSVKKLNEEGAENFRLIATGLSKIARAVAQIPKESLKNVTLMGDAVREITKAVTETKFDLAKADSLARLFNRLGPSLKVLFETVGKIDRRSMNKLREVFASLSVSLKIISALTNFVPGRERADELTKGFDRLGRALIALERFSKNVDIDFKFFGKIALVVGSLAAFVRIGARIAGNAERIKAFGDAVLAISRIFNTLIRIQKENIDLKGLIKTAREFRKIIRELAKGAKDLKGLGSNPLQGFNQVVDQFSKTGELSQRFNNGGLALANGFFAGIKRGFSESIGGQIFDDVREFVIRRIDDLRGETLNRVGDFAIQIGRELQQNLGLSNILESEFLQSSATFQDLSVQLGVFGGQEFISDTVIKQAQDFANIIGRDYPLSANEALESILDLSKAGQEFANIQNILPTAADLATLSETGDIEKTTEFLIASRNAFKEFSDGIESSFDEDVIATAADTVFAAANVSLGSVNGLIDSLNRAAPAAGTAGETLEDTAAVLAAFADATIESERAGRTFIATINAFRTDRARKELARLGVAYQNQDGTLRSLDEIIVGLNDSYQQLGFTEAQINDSIRQFGDVLGQQGIQVLLATDGISSLKDQMNQVGSASDGAKKLLESFTGQMRQLRGSFETLLTRAALPLLENFFQPFAKLAFDAVNVMLSLSDETLELISTSVLLVSTFATVSGAALILTGVFLKLSAAMAFIAFQAATLIFRLPQLIINFVLLQVALVPILALLGTLAIAIAGISALIIKMREDIEDNVGGAGDAFISLKDEIKAFGQEVLDAIEPLITTFRRLFAFFTGNGAAFETVRLLDAIAGAVRFLRDRTSELGLAFEAFDTFLAGTSNTFAEYVDLIEELASTPVGRALFGDDVTPAEIDRVFRSIRNRIIQINIALSNLKAVGDIAFAEIRSTLQPIADALSEVVTGFRNTAFVLYETRDAFLALRLGIVDNTSEILEAIGVNEEFAQSAEDAAQRGIIGLRNAFKDAGTIGEDVKQELEPLANSLSQFFSNVFSNLEFKDIAKVFIGLFTPFGIAIRAIEGLLRDVDLAGFVSGVASAASELIMRFTEFIDLINQGANVGQAFEEAFDLEGSAQLINGIVSAIASGIQVIDEVLGTIGNLLFNQIVPQISTFLSGFLPQVIALLSQLQGPVATIFESLFGAIRSFVETLQFIGPSIASLIQPILNLFAQVAEAVINVAVPVLQGFADLIAGIVDGLGPIIETLVRFFVETLLPTIIRTGEVFTHVFGSIFQIVARVAEPILSIIGAIARLLGTVLAPILRFVGEIFASVWNAILTVIQVAYANIEPILRVIGEIFRIVFEKIAEIINVTTKIFQFFVSILELAFEIIKVPLNLIRRIFEEVFGFIRDKILQPIIDLINGFIDVVKSVVQAIFGPLEDIRRGFEDTFGSIIGFIGGVIDGLAQFVQGVTDSVRAVNNELSNVDPQADLDTVVQLEIENSATEDIENSVADGFKEGASVFDETIQDSWENLTLDDIISDPIADGFRQGIDDSILGNDIAFTFPDEIVQTEVVNTDEIAASATANFTGDDFNIGNIEPIDRETQLEIIDEEERLSKLRETERKELKKENDARSKIIKAQANARDSEREAEDKFRKEQQRQLQDHRDKLLEIEIKGAQSIIDATASRDSAAAIAAVKNAQDQERTEKDAFAKQRRRREEDFKQEIAALQARNELRVQEARARLEEIQAENENNRRLRAEERDRELRRKELEAQEDIAAAEEQTALNNQRRQTLTANEQAITDESTLAAQTRLEEITAREESLNAQLELFNEEKRENLGFIEESIRDELAALAEEKKMLVGDTETASKDDVVAITEEKAAQVAKTENQITDNLKKNVNEREGVINQQVTSITQAFTNMANLFEQVVNAINAEIANQSNQLAQGLNNLSSTFRQGINQVIAGLNNVVRAVSSGSFSATSGIGGTATAQLSGIDRQTQSYSERLRDILGQQSNRGSIQYQTFAQNGADNLFPNRRTRVGENNRPELFFQGGSQFLIPGDRGAVVPLQRGPQVSDRQTSQINNSVYDISIPVVVERGDNVNPDQLARNIERQIVSKVADQIESIQRNNR